MFHKDLQADIVRQNRGATILKESMLLQNKVIFKLEISGCYFETESYFELLTEP